MAFSVIATVTDQGRQRIAQMLADGKSFVIDYFSVSDGGHNTSDPLIALTPDPSAIICPSDSFTFGPTPVNSTNFTSAFCPTFTCVLDTGDANTGLSSICLIATINYSPVTGDPDVGQTFLFAIGNFPLKTKTSDDVFTFNVSIQL